MPPAWSSRLPRWFNPICSAQSSPATGSVWMSTKPEAWTAFGCSTPHAAVDLATRDVHPSVAAAITSGVAERLARADIAFKKIDSRLRGNWALELATLIQSDAFAPLGQQDNSVARTVLSGHLISKMIQPPRLVAQAMSYPGATMNPFEQNVGHGAEQVAEQVAEQGAVQARPVDAGILRSVRFAAAV